MQHFTDLVLSLVEHLGLPGLFAVMVAGNVGIPVGTEIVVPIAGALAATGHLPGVWATARSSAVSSSIRSDTPADVRSSRNTVVT